MWAWKCAVENQKIFILQKGPVKMINIQIVINKPKFLTVKSYAVIQKPWKGLLFKHIIIRTVR